MSTKLLPLLSLLLIATITTTVSARPGFPFHPCNTLIISTYSFSLRNPNNPNHDPDPDPNPNPNIAREFIFHDLRPTRFHNPLHARLFLFRALRRTEYLPKIELDRAEMTDLPLVGLSSFRDRTKDIISVVAALLFGAVCGALTAGTIYLIWSLFNYRRGSYRALDGFTSDGEDDDDNDDIFNPKNNHSLYVPIPASPVKEKANDAAVAAVAN